MYRCNVLLLTPSRSITSSNVRSRSRSSTFIAWRSVQRVVSRRQDQFTPMLAGTRSRVQS
jgi:hypothetical protein